VTFRVVGDVMSNCKKCPEQATNIQPGNLVENNKIPSKENNMVKTIWGLPEHEGVLYSSMWIIFTGGPPEAHLFAINRIIPIDRIQITRKGHIKYKKGLGDFESPSPIDGYQRDEENDYLFLPLWESCIWRQFSISFKLNCQCINIIAWCGKTSEFVKYNQCKQCGDRIPIPEVIIPQKKTISSLQYPEGLPVHSSKPSTHDIIEHKPDPILNHVHLDHYPSK